MTNIELFEYSKKHPETLLDSFYARDSVVIPYSKEGHNALVDNHSKLLDLITTFGVLHDDFCRDFKDEGVRRIVEDIIDILDSTKHINYSPFVQFFMVYNSNYSVYKSLEKNDKRILIYEMLKKYCKERHRMYSSHGYTNTVLQVMCDNYSHKRNSKTGIDKVLSILMTERQLNRLKQAIEIESEDDYYFLPDKGDKDIFEQFLSTLNIKMQSRQIEHNKLPDLVFKHHGHYYICELKTMKEGGGGQNKQIVEIAYFINFSEENPNIHYVTFLDCKYSNAIFNEVSPKISAQRDGIIRALHSNPNNHFLNTDGMREFARQIFT